jgi:hypothetical protein
MHMGGRSWGRALAFLGLLVGVGVIAAFAYHAGTLNAASVGAMHAGGGPNGMACSSLGPGVDRAAAGA